MPPADIRRRTSPSRNGIRRSSDACFAELVAQQPAAVVGDDELDVQPARQQRGHRARGVEAPLAPVIAMATDGFDRAGQRDIDRHRQHEEIQDADVAVQIERALHLRQVVGPHQRLFVDEQQRDAATPAK